MQEIINNRCVSCHAATPSRGNFVTAPAGIKLEDPADIKRWAGRIHEQAVIRRSMPQGNVTAITEEERALLGAWYLAGASGK